MPVEDQQQLCPLGLVSRLEAPRAEQMLRVVLVIFPVHAPLRVVVFPDEAAGLLRLTQGHVFGEQERAVEVARLARCFERGEHRLAHVHVGVLAAIGGELPLRVGFVAMKTKRVLETRWRWLRS